MPDMLGQTDFVTEARTGGWMEKDNFIEQITFDMRNQEQVALKQEGQSDEIFKSDLQIWVNKPEIMAIDEV